MKVCLKCAEIFLSEAWVCPACGYSPEYRDNFVSHAPEFSNGGGGFKSEYFSELARLENSNFWFQARNELILWALEKYKPNANNFLEVGCGTGFVLSGIAKSNPKILLSGSEIFLAGLSHAAARVRNATFMQMDARLIPFAHEFDAIGAFDVLEHITEDEAVLEQLYRALKPDGILLLTVPQHPKLWSASDEYACHVRRYTAGEIEAKVEYVGFKLLRSTSFVSMLLPAMVLARVGRRNKTRIFDPLGEFKINYFLNKIFYFFMALEIKGIRAGFNYPVGGSRLIVARK